jgi:hypothetical protein
MNHFTPFCLLLALIRNRGFLGQKPDAIVQTSAFEQMKKGLAPIAAKAEQEEIGKPSLLITKEEGCVPLKKLEYKPDQPVEELCAAPLQTLDVPAK